MVGHAPFEVDWGAHGNLLRGTMKTTAISNTEMGLNAWRHGGRGTEPSRLQVRLPRLGFRPAPRLRTLRCRTHVHARPCADSSTWSHRRGVACSPAPSLWLPTAEPWATRELASWRARRSPASASRASATNGALVGGRGVEGLPGKTFEKQGRGTPDCGIPHTS